VIPLDETPTNRRRPQQSYHAALAAKCPPPLSTPVGKGDFMSLPGGVYSSAEVNSYVKQRDTEATTWLGGRDKASTGYAVRSLQTGSLLLESPLLNQPSDVGSVYSSTDAFWAIPSGVATPTSAACERRSEIAAASDWLREEAAPASPVHQSVHRTTSLNSVQSHTSATSSKDSSAQDLTPPDSAEERSDEEEEEERGDWEQGPVIGSYASVPRFSPWKEVGAALGVPYGAPTTPAARLSEHYHVRPVCETVEPSDRANDAYGLADLISATQGRDEQAWAHGLWDREAEPPEPQETPDTYGLGQLLQESRLLSPPSSSPATFQMPSRLTPATGEVHSASSWLEGTPTSMKVRRTPRTFHVSLLPSSLPNPALVPVI